MKRTVIVRTVSMAMAFFISTFFLTGCSGRSVNYSIDDVTEHTGQRSITKGLKQFADTPVWRDEWTAVNTKGNTVTVQVQADILLPEAEQMSVVEVEEVEVDSAFKRQVAQSLFDGGNIYYYDIRHLPKEEIAGQRENIQSVYDSYDKTTSDEEDLEIMEELLDDIKAYDKLVEKAQDTYIPVETYDVDEYLGEREGGFYELSFYGVENGMGSGTISGCRGKTIRFCTKDIQRFCPKDLSDKEGVVCHPYLGQSLIDNQCGLSEEEAKKLADEFVENLGLGYSVYVYSAPLAWNAVVNASVIADGYVFCYDAGIDEVSFVAPGTQMQYMNFDRKKESEPEQYDMKARIEVFVNEKGIVEAQVKNPIEITAVSEDAGLLALEDVRSIMKEAVIEDFGAFRFKYTSEDWLVTFNEMELLYFRVRDRKNARHYSYIPVWRLADVKRYEEDHMIMIGNCVLINAIDGSIINFYDEA